MQAGAEYVPVSPAMRRIAAMVRGSVDMAESAFGAAMDVKEEVHDLNIRTAETDRRVDIMEEHHAGASVGQEETNARVNILEQQMKHGQTVLRATQRMAENTAGLAVQNAGKGSPSHTGPARPRRPSPSPQRSL